LITFANSFSTTTMATRLKITKHNGTVHHVPVGGLANQIRLTRHQPTHRQSKIEEEEVDDKGNGKVVKVHYAPQVAPAVAEKDTEIQKLKAQLEAAEKAKAAADKKADAATKKAEEAEKKAKAAADKTK
jgi:hypothetical protein